MADGTMALEKVGEITLPRRRNGWGIESAGMTTRRAPAVVENIEVVYNDVILVLRGLSLTVPKGAIVALLGARAASRRR